MLAAALLSVAGLACAQPVHVQVDRRGELIVIDVDARTLVDPQLAFAVLTDYEHMASFVSALKSSSARRTGPHTLEVEQVAQAKVAFMDFKVWSVRAVELLPPREVRSHLVRGDFKSYDFVTRVGPHPEGGTLVTHHGEYVPNAWLPPMIGPAVIRQQTERQYEELIAEMERRAGLPARDAAAAPRGGDAAVGR